MFKKKIIKENIVCLTYPTGQEMCQAFVRIGAFYESPYFMGNSFTLKEFKKWYIKEFGAWTHDDDWAGFNVPGKFVRDFTIHNPKMSEAEKAIVKEIPAKGRFYLIALYEGGSASVRNHEIAHGLFYVNLEYRKKMKKLVQKYKPRFKELEKYLLSIGYSKKVMTDELHAYLATGNESYLNRMGKKQKIKLGTQLKDLFPIFNAVYKKYREE